MTCHDHREATSAWYDGEHAGVEFGAMLEHARECPACQRYMERLPAQAALLRRYRIPVEDERRGTAMPVQKGFAGYRLNAPMAVAAAIILVMLTIAIQGNLRGGSSYDQGNDGRDLNTSLPMGRR